MIPSAPRSWFDSWPAGTPHAEAPAAAQWVAELAQRLQHLLDTHAETPTSFARRTGLHTATVQALLAGTRWPTIHTAVAASDGVREPNSSAQRP